MEVGSDNIDDRISNVDGNESIKEHEGILN